ncbi:hypothetical protein C7U92_13170 [Bradyrhizobium sp. WBOS7]|uniref:Cell envelope biogenesis protein TolA n=1 Tax=Bradyrhizobium betae TaxID=244734 RepID=A0AAE9SPM4_9BRAD|nr:MULTISPECIES: hypothetical protein [Bradyrhizobium]MDD1571038.1 hypothetical protein [Bradyrhizobium sp. WBOS1]UUO35288.1 hypothetical protein DCK84_12405 [Bradyrhizobium sp. WBOS01]MDD1527749.1 hypothetical protein [Bradyrhizobium sp. WBOS2]MDD1577678.1 hypothetical protein [Bradyrhizobium sp. WBOS7]MDD1600623.1 hypothetical protein [Bradyrhizobium sp. WBOS16]
MLKYLAKISMDIFPSVLATIIGAYIVNHYINAKPAADAPAAVVAPSQAGSDGKPTDTANLPAPGVKARGISEKSISDKGAADKAAADKAAAEKPADKHETKAADIAPADAPSHGRPPVREKAAAKATPPAAAPVAEASAAPAGASQAATPDANDLARAAIERLRKSPEGKAAETKSAETKAAEAKSAETKPVERTPEPAVREATRVPEAPRVIATEPSAVRPLPPPITVSTPSPESYGNGGSSPSYTASVGNDDPNRMTPPADIPVPVIAPPLDLRADAGAALPRPKKTNVADEMLSGMKSMFHSVLPKGATPD